jgi:uncharacterized protein
MPRLYEGTIDELDQLVLRNQIADELAEAYQKHYFRNVGESEFRSWQQSLNLLNNAFRYSSLKDNRVVIEYELPYSSRRIDVLIFGKNSEQKDNIVLLELKQWSNDHVHHSENEGNVLVDIRTRKEVAHPCLQVEGYHFDLIDFMGVFEEADPPQLSSSAYCHNYSRKDEAVLFAPKFSHYF